MKYILFFALCAILTVLLYANDKKIYVEHHIEKPLVRFVNKHKQHVYCVMFYENKMVDFYVAPMSRTEPKLYAGKLRWWCKEPRLEV